MYSIHCSTCQRWLANTSPDESLAAVLKRLADEEDCKVTGPPIWAEIICDRCVAAQNGHKHSDEMSDRRQL